MDYFNQLAVEFDREPERIERTSKTGDAIMKELRLSSDSRVMDYGAGTGLLTFKLQPHAGSITAVDFSDAMLEVIAKKIARSHVENIQCLKWNVETDEDLPSSFDVLIGSMVLHHIYDVQRALDRFAMMLTEHGQIAVADLDVEEGDFHEDASTVAHWGFDRDELADCLRKAGFRNIRMSTATTLKKRTVSGIEKEYSIFLAAAEK